MRALWRGSTVLVVRGGLLSAGQWLGYDGVKTQCKARGLLPEGCILHVLASVAGGFLSATFACTWLYYLYIFPLGFEGEMLAFVLTASGHIEGGKCGCPNPTPLGGSTAYLFASIKTAPTKGPPDVVMTQWTTAAQQQKRAHHPWYLV